MAAALDALLRAPAGHDVLLRSKKHVEYDPPFGIVWAWAPEWRPGAPRRPPPSSPLGMRLVTDLPPLDELGSLMCHWDDIGTVLWTYEIEHKDRDTPWELAAWSEGRGPWT